MGLGGIRPERDRALQMNQRGRDVSLLAQNETQQIVGLARELSSGASASVELIRGGVKIAARDGFLAAACTNRLPGYCGM